MYSSYQAILATYKSHPWLLLSDGGGSNANGCGYGGGVDHCDGDGGCFDQCDDGDAGQCGGGGGLYDDDGADWYRDGGASLCGDGVGCCCCGDDDSLSCWWWLKGIRGFAKNLFCQIIKYCLLKRVCVYI